MKIGILGSGLVARTLAAGFLAQGDDVTIGTRDAAQLDNFRKSNPKAAVTGVAEAAAFGELIVLAVKGGAAAAVLRAAGAGIDGKTVIDACNPIADAPPEQGVLRFFSDINESLMERLQAEFPRARLVKAFSSVGAACMVHPRLAGGRPTMFIAGNDASAKAQVTRVLDGFGWDTADMGAAVAARAIEPLCMLWCIPGFLRNDWVHAFKLLPAA